MNKKEIAAHFSIIQLQSDQLLASRTMNKVRAASFLPENKFLRTNASISLSHSGREYIGGKK